MQTLLITFFALSLSVNAFAFDNIWNVSNEHLAKTKTGYFAEDTGLQFEAEVINYIQDYDSNKEALDFFRTQFVMKVDETSEVQAEILAERWDDERPDVHNLSTFLKHKTSLLRFGKMNLSFMGQMVIPGNQAVLYDQGIRPAYGIPLDFYHSENFSTGVSAMMEHFWNSEQRLWRNKYLLSWYMSMRLTEKLTTFMDVFVDKTTGEKKLGFSSFNMSFGYDLTKNVKMNLGCWLGGDPTFFVVNTVLGATLAF